MTLRECYGPTLDIHTPYTTPLRGVARRLGGSCGEINHISVCQVLFVITKYVERFLERFFMHVGLYFNNLHQSMDDITRK